MPPDAKAQLEVLSRNCVDVISPEILLKKLDKSLQSRKPLKVKAGFDPSSPDIHLGHTVLLTKLREFQDLGHEVIFIIGDATARVGDPSGRTATRPVLSESEIKANAKTYQKQAFRILDPKKTKTVFNNEWFGRMSFHDMMSLSSRVTVGQILQRDDFSKRMQAAGPISLTELFYPLMQAYDSVKIESDIELGGTDQKFNLLLGRELQKEMGQEPQAVMTLPLLVGLDGVQKMSKSLSNHIGVQDPAKEMFGKIMSISDDLMTEYFQLLTSEARGDDHPKEAKMRLGHLITTKYHNPKEADRAQKEFENVFSKKAQPAEMPAYLLDAGPITLQKLLTQTGLVATGGEAKRLIKQNAVSVDNTVISDPNHSLILSQKSQVIRVGKLKFGKVQAKL